MARTALEKIESLKAEIQECENKEKRLLQKHKQEERKERTRRICQRGGYLEKLMPETAGLTDSQFKLFLERILLTGYARGVFSSIPAQVKKNMDEQARMG
jgi:hypothetical protein